MNFRYGKKEMEYLKSRDRRLGEIIDQIGRISWTVEPDLFSAIVQNIVSQQISGKAAESILARVGELLGEITPKAVAKTDMQAFRSCGVSQRKAEYIKDFAAKVVAGELDLDAVGKMSDAEAIAASFGTSRATSIASRDSQRIPRRLRRWLSTARYMANTACGFVLQRCSSKLSSETASA